MKKSLYLILIIVLCFSGCKNKKDQDQFIRPVKSSVVMQELPNVTEKLSGTIAASTESYPVFRVPGSVNGIFVKPGQYVKKGELIATIDPKEYEVTYAAAESKYKQVQGEVQRVIELYERNSVPKNDYDKAISGLESVKALYETALYNLEDTKLYSPINGFVQQIKVGLYQTVTPLTQVMSIVDTESLCIETNISSALYLKRDQFEYFSASSPLINEQFPLTLVYIAPKSNNSQLYKMQLLMPKVKQELLAPGMVVEITLKYKDSPTTELTVPLSSLFSEGGKSYVWLLNTEELTVNRQQVTLGGINQKGHAITTSGLSGNETIVTAGVELLRENQKVKLEQRATIGNSSNEL